MQDSDVLGHIEQLGQLVMDQRNCLGGGGSTEGDLDTRQSSAQ